MKRSIIILVIILLIMVGIFLAKNTKKENAIELYLDKEPRIEEKNINRLRGKGNTYTRPLTIDGTKEYAISSNSWKTNDENLPLLLQVISPENEIKITFSSREIQSPFFSIPENLLCEKSGYLLKISDHMNNIMVRSRLIVSCKHNGISR